MGFVHLILRKRVTHKINDGVFILSIKLPLSWHGNASFSTTFTCSWVKGEQAFVDDFKRLCMFAHLYKFSLIRGSSTSMLQTTEIHAEKMFAVLKLTTQYCL